MSTETTQSTRNPFDDEQGSFTVLTDEHNRHSLWPAFLPVPSGWSVKFGPADRTACLELVRRDWTDLRPSTLSRRETPDAEGIGGGGGVLSDGH